MRRVLALMLLLLITCSLPFSSGKAVREPTQRDVFLYQYFSHVIVRFDYSIKYALENDTYSLKLANLTLGELELIREEALYYQGRGVKTKVMEVLPPFYDFASNLITLVNLTLEFQRNPSPALASGILSTEGTLERDLDGIDSIELRNGSQVLHFDTRKLRSHLEDVRKLALRSHSPKGLLIGVSDSNPILNETVTIFGSCPGNSSVKVFIEGNSSMAVLVLTPKNGLFSVSYRFEGLGPYRVYAVQGGNRSKTLLIKVRKIPVSFVVDSSYTALIDHSLTLSGRLVDYYGRPLPGRAIEVGNETILTGLNGNFSKVYFSDKPVVLNVTLLFKGDEFHGSAEKTVGIEFKRFPLSIVLTGPSEVTLGREATFNGSLKPSLSVPLTVYVNGRAYSTVESRNGSFSFQVKPESLGELQVYVVFAGNRLYEKATSNVLLVEVVKPESKVKYLAVLLIVVALLVGFRLHRKLEVHRVQETRGLETTPEEPAEIEVPADVGGAYSFLRRFLKERFGLPMSLTPREVLQRLSDWEFYPELERITLIHERAVYGGVKPSDEEVKVFIEAVRRILGGASP